MSVQAVDVSESRPSKYDRLIAMAKAIPPASTMDSTAASDQA